MRAAVLLVVLALSGCGFHLRGSQPLEGTLATVAVRDTGKASVGVDTWYGGARDELRRTVEAALADTGAGIADDAGLIVELLGEQVTRRAAAIGAAANAAEYQLDYELRFRIVGADGSVAVPPTTIHQDAIYRYDETAPMGSAEEESLLRRDMRRDAARQLANRYRRLAVARPAADTPADESAAP